MVALVGVSLSPGKAVIPNCFGEPATAIGTDGNDDIDLSGETTPQVVHGNGGDDSIFGGSAGDLLCGGSGIDEVYGEDGKDKINTGAGRDFGGGDEGRTSSRADPTRTTATPPGVSVRWARANSAPVSTEVSATTGSPAARATTASAGRRATTPSRATTAPISATAAPGTTMSTASSAWSSNRRYFRQIAVAVTFRVLSSGVSTLSTNVSQPVPPAG